MNDAGLAKIDELMSRKYTALEYQQNLIFMKNMGLLLHCSQEIDQSTLLYFSVNGLPVGEKDYVILLFSENSRPNRGQEGGQNLYERSFLYAVVEEAVREEFTGHYVFYPCQLDGRLVVLLHFVTGLLPTIAGSLMDMVRTTCQTIMTRCLETWDLHLSVHASGVITMQELAASYHRLLEEVTFYRFTGTDMSGQVTGLTAEPDPRSAAAMEALRGAPERLAACIVQGDPGDAVLDSLFDALRWYPNRSVRAVERELAAVLQALQLLLLRDGQIAEADFPDSLSRELTENVVDWESLRSDIGALTERLAGICARRLQAAQAGRMAEIREKVRERLDDPALSVASLAAECGMSPSALTGAFRRAWGMTLLAYIQRLRLEKAEDLLRHTTLPLRDICEQCGFGSLETMHRLFRSHLGCTPGQYRRGEGILPPAALTEPGD